MTSVIQETVDTLVRYYSDNNVYQSCQLKCYYEKLGYLPTEVPEGFIYIASGVHRHCFYHIDTDLVYKIPTKHLNMEKMAELVSFEEESYFLLNNLIKTHAPNNLRYATTLFMKSDNNVPVIVQEHLPVKTYSEWDSNACYEFLSRFEDDGCSGLSDVLPENIKQHRVTGDVILFDCLDAPDHYWRTS